MVAKDLLLLPFEMELLQMDKIYKAEVVYNRLCEVVSWFNVSFDVFINTVKQYESIDLGYKVVTNNGVLYIQRVPKLKKRYEQIKQQLTRPNTQGETAKQNAKLSNELFTETQ